MGTNDGVTNLPSCLHDPPFSATPRLASSLQQILVDLIALTLQITQARWNVIGMNFGDIRPELADLAQVTHEHSEVVAERMRALGLVPDVRVETVAATTSLPAPPRGEQSGLFVINLLTQRLSAVVVFLRALYADADHDDPVTAEMLGNVIASVERRRWLLSTQTRADR